jgi:hypothetical protein
MLGLLLLSCTEPLACVILYLFSSICFCFSSSAEREELIIMEGGTVGSWIKLGEMVVAFILMSVRTFIQRAFRAFGLFFIYFDNFSKI